MYNRNFSTTPNRCLICGGELVQTRDGITHAMLSTCVEVLQNTMKHQYGANLIQQDTIEQLIKALADRGASDAEIQRVLNG